MKKIVMLALFGLACSDTDASVLYSNDSEVTEPVTEEGLSDSDFDDVLSEADGELGQLEQPMSAKASTTLQLGTRTAPTRMRCDRSFSGQVCTIIDTKSPGVCRYANVGLGQFSASESTTVSSIVGGTDAGLSSWSFTQSENKDGTPCAAGTDIHIYPGAAGSSGSGSNNINDYVSLTFQGAIGLTEGPGVVGSYQKHTGCHVLVDTTDIYAKGVDAAQDLRLFKHAVAHGLYGCLGLGGRNSSASNHATRVDVNASVERTAMTSGEDCVLESFSTSGATSFNLTTPDCSSD